MARLNGNSNRDYPNVRNAYNHLLNLLQSLMNEFGWDEILSSGKGWRLSQ